jgi:cellulose biosynthesis protein BcsQ
MSVTVIAFFNNKGGVGKTSLVYHIACMFADRGLRVLAADLDPQANLSAAFLDEERLEAL